MQVLWNKPKKGLNMITERAEAKVHFCEQWLHITFKGDIEDKYEVSLFLDTYLQEAENIFKELKDDYEAYLWDLD